MTRILQQALNEALDDEYKACATYHHIISVFGEIRPFINIIEAEKRHIQALLPLFRKYGFSIPEDSWGNRIETPNSLLEACQADVEAEIENAEMYDRLLTATEDYDDVQQVFKNLQRASQENHLPAFQRSVERGGTNRGGSSAGRKDKKRHGRGGGYHR